MRGAWSKLSDSMPQTIKGCTFLHGYMQNLQLLKEPRDFLVIHTQDALGLY